MSDEKDTTTPAGDQPTDIDEQEMTAEETALLDTETQAAREERAKAQLPTCKEMRALLQKPIHPKFLKKMSGRGGSGQLTYVHWLTIQRYLEAYAPNYSYRIVHVTDSELGVIITGELTIPCKDGTLVSSNVGFKEHRTGRDQKPTGYGGAAVVATRQALKRCAADLGLGRGLYDKDDK